jgi:hypothetical protein
MVNVLKLILNVQISILIQTNVRVAILDILYCKVNVKFHKLKCNLRLKIVLLIQQTINVFNVSTDSF